MSVDILGTIPIVSKYRNRRFIRDGSPKTSNIVQELCESRGDRPEPSGFRGRKTILNHASVLVSACP